MNMMDEASARDVRIDVAALSREMGVPVVPTVANRNKGTDELLDAILSVCDGATPSRAMKLEYGREVEKELQKLEGQLAGVQFGGAYSARWVAIKLLEEDREVDKKLLEVSR